MQRHCAKLTVNLVYVRAETVRECGIWNEDGRMAQGSPMERGCGT